MFLVPVTANMIQEGVTGTSLSQLGYTEEDIQYRAQVFAEDGGIFIPNLLPSEDKLVLLFDNRDNLRAQGEGEHWMNAESYFFFEAIKEELNSMSASIKVPVEAQFGIEDWSIISSIHAELDNIGTQHWDSSPAMVITEDLPPALSYALVSWAKGSSYPVAIYQQGNNPGELQYI